MAQPNPSELLTGAELQALNEAFHNDALMSGLRKLMGWESVIQGESMENEALTPNPNVGRIIQYAARKRAAREFQQILQGRISVLTPQGQR